MVKKFPFFWENSRIKLYSFCFESIDVWKSEGSEENCLVIVRRVKTGPGGTKKLAGVRVGIDDDTYQRVEIYIALVSAFLKLVEV